MADAHASSSRAIATPGDHALRLQSFTLSPRITAQITNQDAMWKLADGIEHLNKLRASPNFTARQVPGNATATYTCSYAEDLHRMTLVARFGTGQNGNAELRTLVMRETPLNWLYLLGQVPVSDAFTRNLGSMPLSTRKRQLVNTAIEEINRHLPLTAQMQSDVGLVSLKLDENDGYDEKLQANYSFDQHGTLTGLMIERDPAEYERAEPIVSIDSTAPRAIARAAGGGSEHKLRNMPYPAPVLAAQPESMATGWPTAAASTGPVLPTAAVAGPSGIGSQQHLGASTSAIPAVATPANSPDEHRQGDFYTITAVFQNYIFNRLVKHNQKERLDQLTALGCTTFTDANDISERCNTMPGQYLGTRIYAYRNLDFNSHIVNVYRRVDPSGHVRDFRLLEIEPGASQEQNLASETAILGSMQLSATRGDYRRTIDGPDSLGNSSPPPLLYPLTTNFSKTTQKRAKEFERLGFTIPASVEGLVRRCEAAVNKVRTVNIVPLTTTGERPFHLAWITHGNQTVGLLARQENETMQEFKERAKRLHTRSVGQTENRATFQI